MSPSSFLAASRRRPVAGLGLALAAVAAAAGPAAAADLAAPAARTLVLYRDGPAEVAERRAVDAPRAADRLHLRDLPAAMRAEALAVRLGLPDGTVRVPEAVTVRAAADEQAALLRRLIGREIRWLVPDPESGTETTYRGVLRGVGADGRPLVTREGGLEVLPAGRLRLDRVPDDLAMTRSAAVDVAVPAGESTLVMRYAVEGLSWTARYAATLAPNGSAVRLSGDFLIANSTADGFADAAVRLVAGDVPRVEGPRPMARDQVRTMAATAESDAAGGGRPPARAATGDRHVYAPAGTRDLPADSLVRRTLVAPAEIPAERRYVLSGRGDAAPGRVRAGPETDHPRVELSFGNAADGQLGVPLPHGPVSVYAGGEAADGTAPGAADGTAAARDALPTTLLAEAEITRTPVGGEVTLDLGTAFDITARRRLTDFAWRGESDRRGDRPYEAAHEIVLENAKDRAVTVSLRERFPGAWRLLAASAEPVEADETDARRAVWRVEVPAGGTATLTYRAEVSP